MISDLLPAEILTIIDAVSTAVLAVITYYYVNIMLNRNYQKDRTESKFF